MIRLNVTPRGIAIDHDALTAAIGLTGVEKVKKELTVTHQKRLGKEILDTKIIRLYKFLDVEVQGRTKRLFMVARWSGIKKILLKIKPQLQVGYCCNIAAGASIPIEKYEPGVELDSNQQAIFDYLTTKVYVPEKIQTGSAGAILVMDTGLGKSYLAMQIVEYLHTKTLLILPNTSMLEDWKKILATYYPQLQVGEYHTKAKRDGDFVIMTINSALSPNYRFPERGNKPIPYHQYFKEFGLVVYDEIHNYPTKRNVEVFWRAGLQCVLGLTATPDERDDGMDVIYPKHAGPLVIAKKLPNYDVAEIKWLGEVDVINYHGPPGYTTKISNVRGWTKTGAMHEQFLQDPYRNQLIIDKLRELRKEGKNIFVYSERREYLTELTAMISAAGLTTHAPELEKKTATAKMVGGITSDEKNAAEKADIILMTYGYGKEGISIKKMNAILFATPRKSKLRQIIGRILRRGGDPSIVRHIIDIVDADTPLKKQFNERNKVYEAKNFDVFTHEISYQDIKLPK